MKRGLASPWVHSALAITRRLRLQLSRVDQRKSLKRRAGLPVRAKPDVIVAGPTPAVLAAKNATKTIPIVMIAAGDPVALGWMESLSRPSANVTGMTFTVGVETFPKNLELLREIAPDVRLFAV